METNRQKKIGSVLQKDLVDILQGEVRKNGISNLIILALYLLVVIVAIKAKKFNVFTRHNLLVAYVFALFMSLLPILHLSQVHRHTYLYLTPVWVALWIVYVQDESSERSSKLLRLTTWLFIAYSFLPLYFLDFFNVDNLRGLHFGSGFTSSIIMLTEPIWLNLVLLLSIACYGIAKIRHIGSFSQKHSWCNCRLSESRDVLEIRTKEMISSPN